MQQRKRRDGREVDEGQRDCESPYANQKDALSSINIADTTSRDQRHAEADPVRGDNQLKLRWTGCEIVANCGQSDVDDKEVEKG